jgi:hypothetical protein
MNLKSALLAVPLMAPAAHSQTLTCETQGDRRHCFDHHGYESVEERGRDYVHGHDNQRRAWTTWTHDGRVETWQTRR